MSLWESMGFMRWPLAFSMLWSVGLSLYSAGALFRPGAEASLRTKAWVDGVLFWGAFAAICGVLGSIVGIIIAFQSIEAAGAVHPTLVAGGIKVAVLTSAFGMLLLGASSLSWFGLQLRWRFLQAREVDES